MKIFREPLSTSYGDAYDPEPYQIDSIHSGELKDWLERGFLGFELNRKPAKRQSYCSIEIEHEDIVPMILGLASRLKNINEDSLTSLVIALTLIRDNKSSNEILKEVRKIIQ